MPNRHDGEMRIHLATLVGVDSWINLPSTRAVEYQESVAELSFELSYTQSFIRILDKTYGAARRLPKARLDTSKRLGS